MSSITVALVVIAAIAAWLLIPKKKPEPMGASPGSLPGFSPDPSQSFRGIEQPTTGWKPIPPHAAATEEKLAIVDAAIRERYAKKFRSEVLAELKELTESDG
jgi:hypothetical protein